MPDDFRPKQPIADAIERAERAPRFTESRMRQRVRTGDHPYTELESRINYDRRQRAAAPRRPKRGNRG